MPFKIIRNDITKLEVDAVVNAANTNLTPGGGVCGAIFNAAGYDELKSECEKIGGCPTGSAVITHGYNLKAKYIIHTAGPVYGQCGGHEAQLLYSCYSESLALAKKYDVNYIAFPLISSGIYGYPKAEALKIATNAITDFLTDNDMYIYIVVYDKASFETSSKLFLDVQAYIDDTMVRPDDRSQRMTVSMAAAPAEPTPKQSTPVKKGLFGKNKLKKPKAVMECSESAPPKPSFSKVYSASSLEDLIKNMDCSFSEMLLELIDKSGMTDSQVYNKANIDRRLFSKIRSDRLYRPSKVTAMAFALALELDMDTTRELIGKAGYSMTHSSKFDIIIEYFIQRGNYNVFEINEILFKFDQSLIGA